MTYEELDAIVAHSERQNLALWPCPECEHFISVRSTTLLTHLFFAHRYTVSMFDAMMREEGSQWEYDIIVVDFPL